jgi:hypothetical protein
MLCIVDQIAKLFRRRMTVKYPRRDDMRQCSILQFRASIQDITQLDDALIFVLAKAGGLKSA